MAKRKALQTDVKKVIGTLEQEIDSNSPIIRDEANNTDHLVRIDPSQTNLLKRLFSFKKPKSMLPEDDG